MSVRIHYFCRLYAGLVVGVGSRGHSDSGFGALAVWPGEGSEDRVLVFRDHQAAIDWLKHEVHPDTVIADTMAEFRLAKCPTVFVERVPYASAPMRRSRSTVGREKIDQDIALGYQCPCPSCMQKIGIVAGCFGDAKPHTDVKERP